MVYSIIHPLTYFLIHLLFHSLIRSLTHSQSIIVSTSNFYSQIPALPSKGSEPEESLAQGQGSTGWERTLKRERGSPGDPRERIVQSRSAAGQRPKSLKQLVKRSYLGRRGRWGEKFGCRQGPRSRLIWGLSMDQGKIWVGFRLRD